MDYIKYPFQFLQAQKFFLEHNEYTHFVYLSPDLVITKEQFNELKENVINNDYDVYGPVCNMDKGKYSDKLACCLKLPDIPFQLRLYRFVDESHRLYFLEHDVKILKVKFNALAFCFIKRSILEKYSFTTLPVQTDEKPIWERKTGYPCDLAFAHYCDFSNIDIFVDLRIKAEHLRYPGALQVGKKEPKITFISYSENKEYGIKSITKSKIQESSQSL
ncbi:MAG: hypothetical protein V3U54_13465 [Thermodesulfobacteriota bacterium]